MPIRRSKNLSLLAHIPLADAFLWSFPLQDPLSIMIIWQIQFVSTCLFTLFILAGKFRFLCEPCPLAVNLQRGLSWHPLTVFGAPLQRKAASKKLFQPSQQTGFFLRRLCGVVCRYKIPHPLCILENLSFGTSSAFLPCAAWKSSDFFWGSKPIAVNLLIIPLKEFGAPLQRRQPSRKWKVFSRHWNYCVKWPAARSLFDCRFLAKPGKTRSCSGWSSNSNGQIFLVSDLPQLESLQISAAGHGQLRSICRENLPESARRTFAAKSSQ